MDKCFGQKSENQPFQYASIDNQSDYESLSSPSAKIQFGISIYSTKILKRLLLNIFKYLIMEWCFAAKRKFRS